MIKYIQYNKSMPTVAITTKPDLKSNSSDIINDFILNIWLSSEMQRGKEIATVLHWILVPYEARQQV